MRPRPPTNPDALVAYRLGELRDKFVYPDEIGGGGVALGEGKGGTFTVQVAASNASDLSKSKADFICTGVNDQEIIHQALLVLDEIIPTINGGRVLFSEGDFHISLDANGIGVELDPSGPTGYQLEGVGSLGAGHSTTFILDSVAGSNQRFLRLGSSNPLTVRNIAFDGNGIGASCHGIQTAFATIHAEGCRFDDFLSGITSTNSNARDWIVHNQFFNCGTGIRSQNAHIEGNFIKDSTGTVSDQGGINGPGGTTAAGPITHIIDNVIQAGANYGIITSGLVECRGNHIFATSDSGIFITNPGQGGGKYVDNTINDAGLYGIETSSNLGGSGLIQGNHIRDPQRHGMFIDMVDWQIFDNKIIGAGRATINTYDGIHINKDNAKVIRNDVDGGAGQTRYGINIAAGSNSKVLFNEFNAAADYGTSALNDAGTGTITTPPAGAIGANFSV